MAEEHTIAMEEIKSPEKEAKFVSSFSRQSKSVEGGIPPKFRSSFAGKPWIRIVAFVVALIFLPEQVAQAVEYDWRVIWQKPAVGNTFIPNYLNQNNLAKPIANANLDIPVAIRDILKSIANKPITTIKISPTLSLQLEKPLKISSQRIEEIYNWLIGKPCGTKALFDLLNYKGLSVKEQDIAVLALTVDILNEILKPEGNPKIIKSSLYSLAKAAEFFGLKLYAVKFTNPRQELTAQITPFIAHLDYDHYILITRITDEKVYFSDEHKEEFLTKDRFFSKFSGNALIINSQLLTPDSKLLSDKEAMKIKGGYDGEGADAWYSDDGSLLSVGAGEFNPSVASEGVYDSTSIQPTYFFETPVTFIPGQGIETPSGMVPYLFVPSVTEYKGEKLGIMTTLSSANWGKNNFIREADRYDAAVHGDLAWCKDKGFQAQMTDSTYQTKVYLDNMLGQQASGTKIPGPDYLPSQEKRAVENNDSGRYAYTVNNIDSNVVKVSLTEADDRISWNFPNGAFFRPGDSFRVGGDQPLTGIGATDSAKNLWLANYSDGKTSSSWFQFTPEGTPFFNQNQEEAL